MRYFVILFFFLLVPFAVSAADGVTGGTAPSFVSLSDVPVFNNIVDSSTGQIDLSKVLNSIYGLCIGLAAVLAVIQLMYAGILYMGGDSITEKKVARQKITMALLGLLLVLSPAIVFGIIDKRILSLCIDVSALGGGTSSCDAQSIAPPAPDSAFNSAGFPASGTWESTATGAAEECTKQGGTPTVNGGSVRCTAAALNCPVFPTGSTKITSAQEGCCSDTIQAGCTLTKATRGQTFCSCPATSDESSEAGKPDTVVMGATSGTSWKYTGSTASSCPVSVVDGINLTKSVLHDTEDGHELTLGEKEQCCVALLPLNSCTTKNSFSIATGADMGETCGCQ